MIKYEMTADMTENRQYWKMMVNIDPQRCGDGLQHQIALNGYLTRRLNNNDILSW